MHSPMESSLGYGVTRTMEQFHQDGFPAFPWGSVMMLSVEQDLIQGQEQSIILRDGCGERIASIPPKFAVAIADLVKQHGFVKTRANGRVPRTKQRVVKAICFGDWVQESKRASQRSRLDSSDMTSQVKRDTFGIVVGTNRVKKSRPARQRGAGRGQKTM